MPAKAGRPIQGAFWRAGMISPDLELKDVLPRFTDEAIQVIENHAAGDSQAPMMLYLAYPAPHTPWLPSAEFIGSSKASMYGDFMVMVDAMIGKVLAALDKAKMAEDTLVLFSSDNGPVWYETDVKRFGHDSSGGLRGMKADAWECGHRIAVHRSMAKSCAAWRNQRSFGFVCGFAGHLRRDGRGSAVRCGWT